MLPATLAFEVRRQILHYREATFHMRDPEVEQALRRFFTQSARVCSTIGHSPSRDVPVCCARPSPP